jgi:Nitrate and nitrite sensing/HAMP domain
MEKSPPNDRDHGRLLGLRNWRVRSKLIAVLVIPAVAFLVLASFGIGSSIRNAQAFDRGSRLADLGREATALVHELQSERDLTAGFIGARGRGSQFDDDALVAQQRRVDQAVADYRDAEQPLHEELGQRLEARFDVVRAGLNDLAGLREAVRSGSVTERGTFQEYSQTTGLLLDINGEIAEPGGDEGLAQQVRAFNDLAQVKELTSQVRGTLYAIAVGEGFAFRGFQDFTNLLAQRQAALDRFQADASDAQRGRFADVVQGHAVLTVLRIQRAVANSPDQTQLDIDPQQWLAASTTEIELLRTVENGLLDEVNDNSQALSTSARRDALGDALLIAVILAIALLALLLVARSMAQPLQRLRAGAMEIAEHRLPDAVQRLRTTETGDLDVRVEPLGMQSKEEIGQVAQAVDAIQEVAVRLASEQAALRRSIGDMFTNMARRSQTLIDRQLELIDDLERNETDPETLGHLFRLDHLATRMRRNAEDLIVLSGADPGRHWVQPMTLVDVVRAAAAEVEEYQRVEFLPLADVEVAGHAAVDVIHLLAELIENATAFSPPNTKVQIAGQAVPHGYVIEIEDRGLGMSDEELIQANERLANPPEIDFALSRVLGLYVVGRLGQRHGIKVQLRHSWYGGVTALTLLPHALLIWPKLQPAVPEPAAVPGRAELPPPEREAPVPGPAPSGDQAAPSGDQAAPSGDQAAPSGDHLPIFEAARSDWFVTEPSEPAPLPHRQRQHQRATADGGLATDGGTTARQAGHPAGAAGPRTTPPADAPRPYRPAPAADMPAPYPPPPPPVPEGPPPQRSEPVRAADDDAPLYRAERARLRDDTPPPYRAAPRAPAEEPPDQPAPAAAPPPGAAAPAATADQGERLTQAGLPRRVPRANMAPGMVTREPAGGQPPGQPAGRSPDEVRSMLSSYRTGIERGRSVAGGSDPGERPPDTP